MNENDIDIGGLQLQVTAETKAAVSALNALSQTLNNLKTSTKVGTGLSDLTKKLNSFNIIAANVDDSKAQAVKNYGKALQSWAGISALSLSRNIPNQLQRLNSILSDTTPEKIDNLKALGKALSALPTEGNKAFNSTINAVAKLPKTLESLDNIGMENITQKFKELAAAVKPLGDEMQKVANGFAAFPNKIQKLIAGNEKIAEQKQSTVAQAWKALKVGAITAGLSKLSRIGQAAFQESSAYVENLNLFYVTMGKSAKSALEYAQKVNKALGIDVSDWIRNLGTFRQIGAGFGVIDSKAELMAQNLTQIGYDISSFFNIDITEAMNKVRSGFTGELEPLRNLGYALDAATLQQVAYAHGVKQSYNTMTQAQKSQLRYIAILEQSKNVMGDMARTVTSPENAVRILNQQITQLKRELGMGLLPILQKIIPYLSAGVQLLTEWLSALVGYEMPDFDYSKLNNTATIADDVQTSLDGATKAAKELNAALGIDELNVISPNTRSGSGTGDNGLGYDLNIDLPSYDFLAGLSDQTNGIKEQMRAFFEEWGGLIKTTGVAIATYLIGKKALTGWSNLKQLLGAAGTSFKTLYKTSWSAATGSQKLSKALFGATGVIAGMGFAYSGAKDLSKALSSNDGTSLTGSIVSLVGGVAAGALGGAAIGGPIGALVGGLLALVSAGIGAAKAQDELRRKMLTENIFNGVGKSINELTDDYKRNTKAIDDYLETNSKLNDELNTQRTAFDEAAAKVENYMTAWSETGKLDSTQFDDMTNSIKNMVKAAQGLADVNFNKIFASLNGAIKGYLTGDALKAIQSTRTELAQLQAQVGQKVSSLGSSIDNTLSHLSKEKDPRKRWELKQLLTKQLSQLSQVRNAEQTARDNAAAEKAKKGVLSSISLGRSLSDFDTQFGNLQNTYNSQKSGIQSAYEEALLSVDILRGQAKALGINLTDKEIQAFKDSITKSYSSQLKAADTERSKVKQQLLTTVRQLAANSLNDEIVRALISDDFNKGIFPGQRSLVDYPTFFSAMAHSGDYLAYYKKKISTGTFPSDYLKFYRLSDGRTLADIWNKIQSFSTGGFPTTGQLFIANEAGPELVGSMGNKTTVANNQQIVAGIARGVADANAEQNELLRRQNELLVAILQKEGNVTLDGRELLRTTERAAYNRGVQFAEGGLY